MTEMKLSGSMKQVLLHLERGARLMRADGAWIARMMENPEDDAQALTCTRATVVALQRRGLIRAPGQDDLPWEQRQWVLSSVARRGPGLDATHRGRQPMGREELRDRIREAAYLKAEADGFRRDADTYWLEAEQEVHAGLLK